jgi:hypothetical protein
MPQKEKKVARRVKNFQHSSTDYLVRSRTFTSLESTRGLKKRRSSKSSLITGKHGNQKLEVKVLKKKK